MGSKNCIPFDLVNIPILWTETKLFCSFALLIGFRSLQRNNIRPHDTFCVIYFNETWIAFPCIFQRQRQRYDTRKQRPQIVGELTARPLLTYCSPPPWNVSDKVGDLNIPTVFVWFSILSRIQKIVFCFRPTQGGKWAKSRHRRAIAKNGFMLINNFSVSSGQSLLSRP